MPNYANLYMPMIEEFDVPSMKLDDCG
jgi:hypothetical protein